MRKLFACLFLFVGLTSVANNFKEKFYEMLSKDKYEKSDSILLEWEKVDANNPELIPARFNMLINRAHNSIMVLDNSTNPQTSGEYLALTDSLGNDVGSFYEREYWNDSLISEAFKVIDRGIELYPNRLDFRFGKATACIYAKYWETLLNTSISILEYSRLNNCLWQWADGEQFDTQKGTSVMLEGLHEYGSELAQNQFPDVNKLVDLELKYYPSDEIALTLKGYLTYFGGEKEKGIEYTKQAYAVEPNDPLIICNLAYMYYEMGNLDDALALYNIVIDNDNFDEEWKGYAKDMIKEITTGLEEMSLYQFEFKFIPLFASKVQYGEDSIDLLCDTEYILGQRLKKIGYASPLNYKEVTTDVIGKGEDAIVVWTLPDPSETPLAKYIAFVLNKETSFYQVYTLEKSMPESVWILGLAQINQHSAIAMLPYQDTAQEFVKQVLLHINDVPKATLKRPSK